MRVLPVSCADQTSPLVLRWSPEGESQGGKHGVGAAARSSRTVVYWADRVGFESWPPEVEALDKSVDAASASSCVSDRTSFPEGEPISVEKQAAQRAVGPARGGHAGRSFS